MGIITYNTLVNISREKYIQEGRILASLNSHFPDNVRRNEELPLLFPKEEEQSSEKDSLELLPKIVDKVEEENETSPLTIYSENKIPLVKSVKVTSMKSESIKLSLFHMIYSFQLYKSVLQHNTKQEEKGAASWNEEVEAMWKSLNMRDTKVKYPNTYEFYKSWNNEFKDAFTNPTKLENSYLPTFSVYPAPLKWFCDTLYGTDLKDLKDFQSIYQNTKSKSFRNLLELWLYDNAFLFQRKTTLKEDSEFNEKLFQTMIQDIGRAKNTQLFLRFSSIILKPSNPRKSVFFSDLNGYNVPSVSLETLLGVIDGFAELSKDGLYDYTPDVTELIKMLKSNCIITNKASGSGTGASKLRILLPYEDGSSSIPEISDRVKQRCYEILSQDKHTMETLNQMVTKTAQLEGQQ